MSSLNEAISREILYINDRLSAMPELFTSSNGLLEYLVEQHVLDRGEAVARNLPMGCVLNRYQFSRKEERIIIDVRSNHHLLEGDGMNFTAAVVAVRVIVENRVYEPLLRSLDPNDSRDRQVWSTVLPFLRALLPEPAPQKLF